LIAGILLAYGTGLAGIGLASAVATSLAHWTVLIPAILGGIVLFVYLIAGRGLIGWRLAAIATLFVIGVALMGTLSALPQVPDALAGSGIIANPAAVFARAATATISLIAVVALAIAILRKPVGPVRPDPRL
jgi:hypothetical protein